jgi:L-2-hydroxyglutarate oxidase LhgO
METKAQSNNEVINIQNIKNGVYIIKVTNKNIIETAKLIIQ